MWLNHFVGIYYNYDSSTSKYHNSIMADQMAGQWYLKACDLGQSPSDRVMKISWFSFICFVFEKFRIFESALHCYKWRIRRIIMYMKTLRTSDWLKTSAFSRNTSADCLDFL